MIELVDQTFDELVLDSSIPVIVDFHANASYKLLLYIHVSLQN